MVSDLRFRPLHLLVGLLASTLPAFAQPSLVVDLADLSTDGPHLHRVFGSDGTGQFGLPVAGGFDVDGDGSNDYAVGYMTIDSNGLNLSGEVNLVFGDGTTTDVVDTANADPRVLRFLGAGERETAGSEIWMDDVTGDGIGDLLICRQNFTPSAGREGAGALNIVVGGAALRTQADTLTPVSLASPPPSLTLTNVVGVARQDRLGIWARTGDIDGDGIADIVVGADQSDAMGESNRGSVYVVRGGAHLATGGTVDLANFGSTPLAGNLARLDPPVGATNFHLGGTVQIADLDGNGRGEVLAAATVNRAGASIEAVGQPPGSAQGSGGAPHGELFIVWDDNFPQEPWVAGYNLDVSAAPGRQTRMVGETFNISFGEEVLGGLDYDGNGQADLFVGDLVADGTAAQDRPSSGLGHLIFDAADLADLDVDMQSPPPELQVHRILGPGDGAISSDTAAHGDFDHDGFADLAFASPHATPEGRVSAGAVHVLFGRQGGWPLLIDLLPGQQPTPDQVRFTEIQGANGTVGSDTGDTLGYSAAAGDIDGDGIVDLIINEMVGNGQAPGTVDVGNLILINGLAIGSGLFVDGFESGSTAAWSTAFP